MFVFERERERVDDDERRRFFERGVVVRARVWGWCGGEDWGG